MSNDLADKIVKEYVYRIQTDRRIREVSTKIRSGGDYGDAEEYATRAGEILTEVFHDNITADNFPVGSVDEIYQLIKPAIEMNYEANSQAVSYVQKNLNTEGGIGMKPIPTKYDDNATMNIAGRMAKYESFEDAEYMLGQPMVTNSLGTVDKALRENADFQYKSGLKPKIVRTCEPDACEWCQELADSYDYEEVKDRNNPVFQRHNNCACEITYEPGDGRVQDVNSRQWLDQNAAQERISFAKSKAQEWFEKRKSHKLEVSSMPVMMRQKDYNRKDIHEISRKRFLQILSPVLRQGAKYHMGNEEGVNKYLDLRGADAMTTGLDMYFREQVTLSEALEETYHVRQNLAGMNDDKDVRERFLLNEIDAQKWLIEHADKYHIPRKEREQTERALEMYQNDLYNFYRRYGIQHDESDK